MSNETHRGIEAAIHSSDRSLHTHPNVEVIQTQKELRGETSTERPTEKLIDFFEVWENIIEASQAEQARGVADEQETVLDRMKQIAYELYVIKPEDIPESYFEQQQQIARQQGHGDIEITDAMREQAAEVLRKDQMGDLNAWVSYLAGADNPYPVWLRYWALDGVTKLRPNPNDIVDEDGVPLPGVDAFVPRRSDTVAGFPELNAEAIADVMAQMETKYSSDYIHLLEEKDALQREIDTLASYDAVLLGISEAEHLIETGELSDTAKQRIQKEIDQNDAKLLEETDAKKRKGIQKHIDRAKKKLQQKSLHPRAIEALQVQVDSDRSTLDALPQEEKVRNKKLAKLNNELANIEAKRHKLLRKYAPAEKDIDTIEAMLEHNDFRTLYNKAYEQVGVGPNIEELQRTNGQWVKYEQGSDFRPLQQSLQGKGTRWCTAREGLAQSQLSGGDFYVYYSEDDDSEFTIPRAAIRMEEKNGKQRIAEVRGIAANQNMDPYINPIVKEKLREFPDGENYSQAAEDMELLRSIEQKHNTDEALTIEELRFLYEIDRKIKIFGEGEDPRIRCIQKERNRQQDFADMFAGGDVTRVVYDQLDVVEDTCVVFNDLSIQTFASNSNIAFFDNITFPHDEGKHTYPKEVAIRLLDVGEGYAVAKNIDRFEKQCHSDMAIQLLDVGEGYAIAENIDRFVGLNNNDMAIRLLDVGKGNAVAKNLGKFKGLSGEVALRLIDAGAHREVGRNLGTFKGLGGEVAMQLFDVGERYAVAKNIDRFVGLNNNDIAIRLLDGRYGYDALVKNLSKFKGLSEEVALRLIDAGARFEVGHNLDNFEGINHSDIALRLFDGRDGYALVNNIDKFKGLNAEVALRLIDVGLPWEVCNYLDKFEGINHNDIALRLIDAGYGYSLARGLDKFKGLSAEVALRLIDAGLGWEVGHNLDKFEGLNHNDIALLLIDAREGRTVARNLDKFKELNAEVALRLIDAGEGQAVANNLDSFVDLDHYIYNKLKSY